MRGSTSSSYRAPSIVILTLVIRPPRRPTWADALFVPQAHLRAKPRTPPERAPVPTAPAWNAALLVIPVFRTHAGAVRPLAISVGTLRLDPGKAVTVREITRKKELPRRHRRRGRAPRQNRLLAGRAALLA